MKSPLLKKKSQKSNISTSIQDKPQKYINKNISKKYVYKKEKAADTEKVLQNNKLSKNFFFSPIHDKKKEKPINNNINSDLRRPPEIREDVNIDYEKYQQQTLHTKTASLGNFSFLNNNNILSTIPNNDSNILNQSNFLLERKNGFMVNSNRSVNDLITKKWKCSQCGNVNSNFNYLCNNCNMPNTSLPNDTSSTNPRNNSAGKNIKQLNIDNNNITNSSFNINSSNNIFTKSINSNNIMKRNLLKKNKTKEDLTSKSNNAISSPYYSNIGFNTIRPNKNNSNYFYNEPIKTNITNSSNFYETDRDSNITHLYSYSNYLANELKTCNDANMKLMENYQNNENEYKSIYEQNDLIKKKIKILKEKENQLDKINDQLQQSLQFIKKKFGYKNNNNYIMNTLNENEEKNLEDLNDKIKQYNEENEKLREKLKENRDIISKMKIKIEELSEENNKDNEVNIQLKQNIDDIIDIKNNIEKYTKEIKEQNQIFFNTITNSFI